MNTQLNSNDTIFATVISGGKTIVSLTLSGFTSMSDVIKLICNKLGEVSGLVTVELRNSTLGWLERRSLRLRSVVRKPVQLTLF